MILLVCYAAAVTLVLPRAAIVGQASGGWLDKVVAYYKHKLFLDMEKVPSVQIKATIQRPPPGYKDSEDWDEDSVVRLMVLMRRSEASRRTFMAVNRALQPTRRDGISLLQKTFELFPSLAKDHANVFYYSYESESDEVPWLMTSTARCKKKLPPPPSDDDVIYISNPVEARLPSARITVGLLREILEIRAIQARVMPTSTVSTINWSFASGGGDGGGGDQNGTANGNGTGDTGATGGGGATGLTTPA